MVKMMELFVMEVKDLVCCVVRLRSEQLVPEKKMSNKNLITTFDDIDFSNFQTWT